MYYFGNKELPDSLKNGTAWNLFDCQTQIQILHSHVTAPLYSKVPCKDEDDVSVSSDSLGEQLFELVDVYNTGHSQKITGKQPVLWCSKIPIRHEVADE